MFNLKSIYSLLFISIILVAVSCGDAGKQSALPLTNNGYQYIMHTDVEGEPFNIGDVVYFKMKVFAEDSLLHDGFLMPDPLDYKWQDEETRNKIKNPMIDALGVMTIGDSVTIKFPVDSIQGGNQLGLVSGQFINYVIKAEKAVTAEVAEKQALEKQAILAIKTEEVATTVANTLKDYKAGKLKKDMKNLIDGLEVYVHEEGTGEVLQNGETVLVDYYGVLTSDGSMFDNSFQRGAAFNFPLGQGRVIKGWDLGLAGMKKGTKATIFIPSKLGYGAAGSPPAIPADAQLAFYVEVK